MHLKTETERIALKAQNRSKIKLRLM